MSADRRQNNYSSSNSGYKGQAMYGQNQQYMPRGMPMPPQDSLQTLTSSMGSINLHGSYPPNGTTKSGGSTDYNTMPMTQGQGLWVPNQHVLGSVYPVMSAAAQQQSGVAHSPGMYNHAGTFVPGTTYQYGQGMIENSPLAPGWASRMSSGDMPSLMTPRRDSISSNENDVPGTPYTSNGVYRYGASTAILDRSPSAVYTSSGTPSPSQLTHPYALVGHVQKQQTLPSLPPHLMALLHKEPAIPRAIPAPSSPPKPLDRSLENKTGETNVYIRGLLPETTDEMLYAWGKRFGDIQSSKSIIDLKSNLCKGYVLMHETKLRFS
jgi:hypothetical protein